MQLLVPQGERVHGAGAIVLDQDVRARGQGPEDLLPARFLQVEDDAALVAVDAPEAGTLGAAASRHRARGVAVRRLDLDHVGAQVPEEHRAEGAGHDLGRVEDADPVEGLFHAGALLLTSCIGFALAMSCCP